MADALPTYPDDQIPLTDRHWRERWALELSRANALERELIQTRAARDAARQTCDDLTAHCEGQGRRIAALEKKLAWTEKLLNRSMCRADVLAQWIEDCELHPDDLAELLDKGAGINCPECQGKGQIDTFDDVMVGGSHSTRDYTVECEAKGCVNGKRLR